MALRKNEGLVIERESLDAARSAVTRAKGATIPCSSSMEPGPGRRSP